MNETLGTGRKWGTLVIACFAALLLAVDLTVLHLAIPGLTVDLAPSATQILWIADSYGFALAGLLITMGNVGDRIGRKRLLLIGTVGFGAASVLTAYATSPELLIAARTLLGVAGATIMPSTLSLIRNAFTDPQERTMAVGIWTGVNAAGFAVGPLVGGLLLDHFWWGSVFIINVPVMAVILVAGAAVLPESRNPRPGRLDLPSVPLSIVGVVAVVYALKEAAHSGLGGVAVPAAAGGGLAVLALFTWRQTRLAEPLIDVRLFRRRAFSASVGANLLAVFAMVAQSLIFSQYFQLVLGWSPLQAGLAGLPGALCAAGSGALAAPLIARLGRAAVAAIGLTCAATGIALYQVVDLDTGYLQLLPAMLAMGAGIGLTFAVTGDTILASVPRRRAGAASAISETAMEIGGALGVAVLGSVLGGVYRSGVELPAGLPPQVAAQAGDSIGGAALSAAQLPAETGAAVLRAAGEAYVAGVHVTAWTGAALLAAAALIALVLLRGVPKVIPDHDAEEPVAV